MTHKSIKLLSLAVVFGCSLIGFAVSERGKELILLSVSVLTGIWFVLYWLMWTDRNPGTRSR